VLEERVGGENAVVRLNDSGGNLRRWVYAESELGLAAVVYGEALKEKRSKTGAGTTSNSVEAEEALKTGAVVSKLANAVKYKVYDLLADGVVATSVVVSSILLAGDDLLRVVESAVGAGANFVTYGGLQVNEHSAGDVFASSGFAEEGVEGIIAATDGLVGGHLAVGLDAVLKAVELPAGITYLDASLANVDADYFTHDEIKGLVSG